MTRYLGNLNYRFQEIRAAKRLLFYYLLKAEANSETSGNSLFRKGWITNET